MLTHATEAKDMNEMHEEPREAEILASVLAGTGSRRGIGVLRPVMARMPEWQLAQVDAMARIAGKSRSSIMVHLITVGIEEVMRASKPATVERFTDEAQKVMHLLQENTTDREGGEF
jgi:hypothetical protein